MINSKFFLTLLFVLLSNICLYSQDGDTIFSDEPIHFPSDFFDVEKPIEIDLEFNIKDFIRNKEGDEYLPAIITVRADSLNQFKKPLKIKPRGISRKSICFFPPYLLNFKKSDVSDDLPSDINKIKVVTHCKRSKEYTNYIFKEYLAYKLYTIITEYSFKVRLAKITYIDSDHKSKPSMEWAFLIEPEDMLAERLNALPIQMDKMSHTFLDTLNSSIMVMFQYMIGNTDFGLTGRHNLKLIKLKDYSKPSLFAIPFDFDYSGLVNAHYALPKENLPIKKVTERSYYGMCRNEDVYNEVIQLFLNKKDEIFNYINSAIYLDDRTKKYVLSYIEDFYKEISKKNFIKNNIEPNCFK